MLASQNGHEQCIRALIQSKANLDATQNQGFTSLMLAANNGHDLCARALIEASKLTKTVTSSASGH